MKKKENKKMKTLKEEKRHTVQVSDKAWKVLTVLKLMYNKSLGNLIEESAMNMIRSTPFGIAHLNLFLSSQKSDTIKKREQTK